MLAKDLKKEQWKELAKEFAEAYLDILPAVGHLDPETNQHWLALQSKARMLLSGNVCNEATGDGVVDPQIYSALQPLFNAFALKGRLRAGKGNTAYFAELHTSTTPEGVGTPELKSPNWSSITLGDLDEIRKLSNRTRHNATMYTTAAREVRDRFGLTDREALALMSGQALQDLSKRRSTRK